MSHRLEKRRIQLVMIMALRHGVREASRILAGKGLIYSPQRISKMFKSRDHLSTVMLTHEIDSCCNFKDFQNVFNSSKG